ncbi:MAG: hypothetical protein KPEEDBHJ_01212 [Anaerolineales bacterium]|nr:hypothetical protein [Anaerolineales bacterium]
MMESFLTLHPDSTKKGVKIEKAKYDTMRNAILETLRRDGAMPFMELAALIEDQLRGQFDGSVMWYYTTVKLDLEARGEIRRVPNTKPQRVELVSS